MTGPAEMQAERIEALEAKCALLSASLNKADDELEQLRAKLSALQHNYEVVKESERRAVAKVEELTQTVESQRRALLESEQQTTSWLQRAEKERQAREAAEQRAKEAAAFCDDYRHGLMRTQTLLLYAKAEAAREWANERVQLIADKYRLESEADDLLRDLVKMKAELEQAKKDAAKSEQVLEDHDCGAVVADVIRQRDSLRAQLEEAKEEIRQRKETEASLHDWNVALGARVEKLTAVARHAEHAVATLPMDCLGQDPRGWFYRDELLHRLRAALEDASEPWVQCTSVNNNCLGGCATRAEHERYNKPTSKGEEGGE